MRKSMANFNTFVRDGQNVVSSKVFNRKDKNTEAQKNQRQCFKLIVDVWASLGGYGDLGFPVRPAKQSPYNYFMMLNLPDAIDSTGDTPVIDYSQLQIAKGSLPMVQVTSATLSATGVTIGYESNFHFPKAAATDKIQVLMKLRSGALYAVQHQRGEADSGSVFLPAANLKKEDVEFAYLFLTSADGSKASNSVLLNIG